MTKNVSDDLFGQIPVVGSVGAAIEAVVRTARRLFGPSQGQAIAQALREGLHEYVKVADKFAIARLIEAQARLLEAAARFEEARAAAYVSARKADAEYLRALALFKVASHATNSSGDESKAPIAFDESATAMNDIVELLRELVSAHIADFDAVVAAPLVQLLPSA